jgi:hypothetical protein
MRISFTPNSNRKTQLRLARGLTLFFLLFTGADLFMPQYFCGAEEAGGLTLNRQTVASTRTSEVKGTFISKGNETSRSENPTPEAPHEEDCFCCCAHVLPGTGVVLIVISDLASLPGPETLQFVPSPPLQGTYHPPRFA